VFVTGQIEPPAPAAVSAPDPVVIVGAGAAGVHAADTLRREGYAGSIILISRETELPYDKPNLSKDFLAGAAPAEWLPLHPPEHYEQHNIDVRLGVTVSAIDTAARHVTTSSGERLAYGALVLATGATPRLLTVRGAERVLYLRTRGDAERIVAAATAGSRAVVIGSSFIGLEVAASLRARDVEVVVVAPDAIPLARILGTEIGTRIRRIHEEHGVSFRLERGVVGIEADAVLLDDGSRIAADLVVAGIGVTPSLELARAAGITVANGVVVNEYLETSAPNVFACGDIASWPDGRSMTSLRVEHWVVATRQGQTAARNILGRREKFDAVPFFWSAHYDVTIAYVGHAMEWDAIEIDGSLEANDASVCYRKGDTLLALATIGRDRASLAAEAAMERSV
jgi:3-phenylpropionate/trans-cinnamate dioxygenase ferredoxin reductase subunit